MLLQLWLRERESRRRLVAGCEESRLEERRGLGLRDRLLERDEPRRPLCSSSMSIPSPLCRRALIFSQNVFDQP